MYLLVPVAATLFNGTDIIVIVALAAVTFFFFHLPLAYLLDCNPLLRKSILSLPEDKQ
jgi:hypothetical protein